ncbi:TonB-dependent receptor [Labilibaculum sp. DW002]|uniref:TonB-dependent receptor n=1 Tax=Paralabilibaculum antarcticum TaxID=2912572 RepID=A0ABT5VN72_9BACT|nr:TonB-dependent receptor [Labilibaculum sp. DW002]MDE5416875.1 TonB-dependent receptor [Labilibaculum sp. DW002]
MNFKFNSWKRALPLFLVFLFPPEKSFSQKEVEHPKSSELKGNIVDFNLNKSLEYATVSIFSLPDSLLIKGTITNRKGDFLIQNLKEGKYFYKVEYLGYQNYKSKDLTLQENEKLVLNKSIALKVDTELISQVEVTGNRDFERIELDRSVYNVSNSLASNAGNITDVLTTIPKLNVDTEGNLKYRGSSNVKVLIDGKMSRLLGVSASDILNSLPANDVDRVEIISNPSAKFDASGSAGIVNIIMKKNRSKGFKGNTSIKLGTKNKKTGRTSLSLRTGKFNFSGSYSYTDDWFGRDYSSSLLIDDLNLVKSKAEIDYGKRVHLGQFGMDLLIDDNNTLSFNLSKQDIKQNWNGEYNYLRSDIPSSVMPEESFRDGSRDLDYNSMNYNMAYIHKFKRKGQQISIDAAYTDNSATNKGLYRDFGNILSSSMSESSDKFDAGRKEGLIQVDYQQALGQNGSLESGFMYRSNEIEFKVPIQTEENFDYKELIHSAYTQISGKKGNLGYQFGLRAEYSDVKTNKTYNEDYLDVFPSFHLSYKLSENKQLQLSYAKMVVRPNSGNLNPFQNVLDSLNQRLGSQDIRQYYTHKPELTYIYRSKKVTYTTNLYFQVRNDCIKLLRSLDSNDNTVLTSKNIDKTHYAGLDLNMAFKLNKWWSVNSYLTGNYQKFYSTKELDFKNRSDFGYFGGVTSTMRIPKLFTVQTKMTYYSEMPIAQGNSDETFHVDLTLAKRIMKKKAVVSLKVYDLFNSMKIATSTSDDRFKHRMRYQFENRIAYFTFTYYFGKKYSVLKTKKRKYVQEHKTKDI